MTDQDQGVELLPSVERKINGRVYIARALQLGDWLELTEFLSALLGAPAEDMLKGYRVGDLADLLDGDAGLIGGLLNRLTSVLRRENTTKLLVFMGKGLEVRHEDGSHQILSDKTMPTYWPRRMGDLMPVIWLFLEAQYRAFLGGMGSLLPGKKKPDVSLEASTLKSQ